MGTSYIPFPPWAVFFCYVPLWIFALKQERIKPLLIGAWLCQFIATLIGFNWVAYTIREFGFFPWPLSILGLLFFAGFANLHIPIALFFWFVTKKKILKTVSQGAGGDLSQKIKKPVLISLIIFLTLPLYSALVMKYYPMIFGWNFGYTWFYFQWPAVQTAEIWGVQFLHTLTLFSNLLFLYVFLLNMRNWKINSLLETEYEKQEGFFFIFHYPKMYVPVFPETEHHQSTFYKLYQQLTNRHIWMLLFWIACFVGLNVYGWYLKNRWPEPDQTASVLMVQPNLENLSYLSKKFHTDPRPFTLKKLIKETFSTIAEPSKLPKPSELSAPLNRLNRGTQWFSKPSFGLVEPSEPTKSSGPIELRQKIDFILWPEGTYPYAIKHNTKTARSNPAQDQAKKWQTPIVLSAIGQNGKRITNSVFVFNEDGKMVQAPYNKTLLLAFGEYIPGETWLPIHKLLSYYGRSFTRGTGENKVILLNGIKLGFQICYEGIFDFFTRDLVLEKAQIIVNVTNDSWYGSWQEPYQHLYMTLSRAIEVRRPLIRGTNTGFSGFISAKGEIGPLTALNKSVSWIQPVPYYSQEKQTVFTSWGYYIDAVFLWFLFIVLLSLYILNYRKKAGEKAGKY